MEKLRVLFVCEDNSIRSQIAAAFLNKYFGERFVAFCAGVKPQEINPYVVKALGEIGVDISRNKAKALEEFHDEQFDYIVTLCEHARNSSRKFPQHKKQLHKSFKDHCVSSLCAHAKKCEFCAAGHHKHLIQDGSVFSGDQVSEEEITASLRLLIGEIFEWVEKEAVF